MYVCHINPVIRKSSGSMTRSVSGICEPGSDAGWNSRPFGVSSEYWGRSLELSVFLMVKWMSGVRQDPQALFLSDLLLLLSDRLVL